MTKQIYKLLNIQIIHLLLLITVANAAPIIARRIFLDKYQQPIDAGRLFVDDKPLLGVSKTWRGLISSFICTAFTAWLLGYEVETGLFVAMAAMSGDLISSFSKRRIGLEPSTMMPFVDQVPESILPAILMMQQFSLSYRDILFIVIAFFIIERVISKLLFFIGIRKRPY